MEWGVELQGDTSDLEVLSKALNEDDLSIIQIDGLFVLKSNKFNTLTDAQSVKELAETLLQIINSLGELYFEGEANIKIGAVASYGENGSKGITVFPDTLKMKVKMSGVEMNTTQDGKRIVSLVAQGVKDSWKIVFKNDNLLKAVRIYRKEGKTWYGIYKVVNDTILRNRPDAVALGWISQSKIDLLKHTANCYKAIGDEARHAIEEWQSPPKPMSIQEARSIVEDLLKKWVQYERTMNP